METLATLFASIDYRDPIWIAVAYLFGLIAWQIRLPPLVGFLLAGFALNAIGASGGEFLNEMADLGVTLLLFTIGLKLNIKQLLRPEIWGVATLHMLIITLGTALVLWVKAGLGVPFPGELGLLAFLLPGFALSFSSTVFAVKVFEDKGSIGSRYARIAVGILIVQDMAAVIFLAASTAKIPSPWAASIIIALLLAKPLLILLLKRAGHGELLILYGLVLALGGSALFELVSLKGDLGALFFGVLLAQHPKASELAKSLLSLKDLFLVGFFLSIGMAVHLSGNAVLLAVLLLVLLPLKMMLFFLLFMRFRLRVRTATFSTLSLANFSEFGLIVTAIAVGHQWLAEEWLAVMAIAVVLSFILASPLNMFNNELCKRFCRHLERFQHDKRLPGETSIDLHRARVMIAGMGRIGSGAYDHLVETGENEVIGIDFDRIKVDRQQQHRQVIFGDSVNPEFWSRIAPASHQLETILLCMPNLNTNLNSARAIREWGFKGKIAAVVHFDDEIQALKDAGVDSTFNVYAEIGTGFAQHVLRADEQNG